MSTETQQEDVDVVAARLTDGAALQQRAAEAHAEAILVSRTSDAQILRYMVTATEGMPAWYCAAVLDGVRDGLAAQR
jgi:hypothetical protein